MTVNKTEFLMEIDKCNHLWQIINGDDETWIVLRKKRIVSGDIDKVKGVSIKDFTWDMVLDEGEKRLYEGNLGLQVFYDTKPRGDEVENFTTADEEEVECNRSFLEDDINIMPSLCERKDCISTEFSSILVSGSMLSDNIDIKSEEENIRCGVEMPWRAWLTSENELSKPTIPYIHLTQIGLKTLLIEAVVVLRTEKKCDLDSNIKKDISVQPKEEYVILVQDKIEKVLGVIVQRGLTKIYFDETENSLIIDSKKRINVLYISAEKGGERIKTASFVTDRKNKISASLSGNIPPVSYSIFEDEYDIVQLDENRVIYRCNELVTIANRLLDNVVKEKDIPQDKEDVILPMCLNRRKPGERWMKKECSKYKKCATNMTTLVLKLV